MAVEYARGPWAIAGWCGRSRRRSPPRWRPGTWSLIGEWSTYTSDALKSTHVTETVYRHVIVLRSAAESKGEPLASTNDPGKSR